MTSIVAVSLYNVKESKGALSEGSMLRLFKEHDRNGDEVLSIRELRVGMVAAGVTLEQQDALIEKRGEAVEVTFEEWYAIISKFSETDGFASHHSPLIGFIVRVAVRHERARRIAKVANRASSKRSLLLERGEQLRRHTLDAVAGGRSSALNGSDSAGNGSGSVGAPTMADSLCNGGVEIELDEPIIRADSERAVFVGIDQTGDGGDGLAELQKSSTATMQLHGLEKTNTVTEHELSDPAEIAAKRIAGQMDFFMSIAVPLFYFIYTGVILSKGMKMDVETVYHNVNSDAPCVHLNLPSEFSTAVCVLRFDLEQRHKRLWLVRGLACCACRIRSPRGS